MLEAWRAKRHIAKVIRSWVRFRRLMLEAYKTGQVGSGLEAKFLKLNARIAAQLQLLSQWVPRELTGETNSQVEGMKKLLMIFVTMKSGNSDSSWIQEEFDRKWHEHFLYLNKLKGMRLNAKNVSRNMEQWVPTGIGQKRVVGSRGLSRPARVVIGLAVLASVVLLMGWGFGLRVSGNGSVTVSDKPALQDLWTSVSSTVNALGADVIELFSPVLAVYGPVVTTMMLGILLLILGYWIFVRI